MRQECGRSIGAGLATCLIWAMVAPRAAAQSAAPEWVEEPASSRAAPGLLGEGVPPAILLLDLSVPPGITGAAPFGEAALWAPKSRLHNAPGFLSEFRHDASVGGPIYSDEQNTLLAFVDARYIAFHTDAFLKDSRRPFPNQLWELVGGLSFSRHTDNGWTVGGSANVGSPSDRPFNSLREVVPSLTGFVRMPGAREGDAWLLSVSWAPVSLIRFPLPGVAYEWNLSEQLQVVAGVPFSIVWRPTERLRFDAGYMPPLQTRAQATYRILDTIDVFAGFESVNEAYLLDDRAHWRDFFYSYEKRLPAGVRFRFGDHCLLDVAGGYLFDRIYFTSRTFTDESRDRIHVAPSAFGMVRFALTF
jgi:hypothetical protein